MSPVEQRCLRKIFIRFVPLLLICYIVSHMDRVNVGYAALTMNKDLGLSMAAFGLGAGLFFITYVAFEVPSNMALARFGARRWIARIMITWGILSAATAFVQGEASFYTVRLLLGAAEAGFFPGIIFFLTLWVPNQWRGMMIGSFMLAVPLASVIGAPLSAWLLTLDGLWGYKGWQLMFILEALPAILLAPVVLLTLRDKPADAEWLSAEEKQWLIRTLDQEKTLGAHSESGHFTRLIKDVRIWRLALVYFSLCGFSYGMAFFLPLILKEAQFDGMANGFATALPFAIGAIGMVLWGRHSDRNNERRVHTLIPLALACIGLACAALAQAPHMKLMFITLAALGVLSALPVFWTLPGLVLKHGASAAGIAMINAIGGMSGFIHSYVMGSLRDATGSYTYGLLFISAIGVIGLLLLFSLTRRLAGHENGGAVVS